jgi:hypothetical protein
MARAAAVKILATKTATLKVPLTDQELKEVAEQTYRVEGDLRAFYAHKKEVTSDLKAKEESLDSQLAKLGRLGRDKCEYRPVAVRVEADFRAGKVFEIREDTGEIVAERAVNEQDRQSDLFGGSPRGGNEQEKDARSEAGGAEDLEQLFFERDKSDVGLQAAHVTGGVYRLRFDAAKALWSAMWLPRTGKSQMLLLDGTEQVCKDACRKHLTESTADAILANAGDGKLNGKDLKGPAERFKKGGRR